MISSEPLVKEAILVVNYQFGDSNINITEDPEIVAPLPHLMLGAGINETMMYINGSRAGSVIIGLQDENTNNSQFVGWVRDWLNPCGAEDRMFREN